MLAVVRLDKINCFSELSDYKQGDLTSELGAHTHTHTHTHTHSNLKTRARILQFLKNFRASNNSHSSQLILLHPRATRSYTRLEKPKYLVAVLTSFHYIPEDHHILELPPAMIKITESAVIFTKLKNPQQLVNFLTNFTIFLVHIVILICPKQCSHK